MEAENVRMVALATEMGTLRQEIINLKSAAHATLHQASADANCHTASKFAEQTDQLIRVEQSIEKMVKVAGTMATTSGRKNKHLIKPKQVNVDTFAWSLTDDCAKLLTWAESVKDRVAWFSSNRSA